MPRPASPEQATGGPQRKAPEVSGEPEGGLRASPKVVLTPRPYGTAQARS